MAAPDKIFSYAVFSNAQDFETWQRKSQRPIVQMTPIARDAGISLQSEVEASADFEHGIFVIYVVDNAEAEAR